MYVRAIHGNVPAAAPARALVTVPADPQPSPTAPSHRLGVPPYHLILQLPFTYPYTYNLAHPQADSRHYEFGLERQRRSVRDIAGLQVIVLDVKSA